MINKHPAHCPNCKELRHFRKRSPDHLIHLAATIFTLGLWSVGWLSMAIHQSRKPWRCSVCGCRMHLAAPVRPPARRRSGVARASIAQ